MKKTIHQFLIALLVTSVFSSCGADIFNGIRGNGNIVTEERKPSAPFSGIKVSAGIDLYITQGNKNKIIVEADENLQKLIKTSISDGILKIYTEENIWKSSARKVYVTLQELSLLKASSGSDVYSENTINTNEISISASSGADINISIAAENVSTSASSGSDIKISGNAINHATKASSGSSIDAYKLESKNVIARVSSGADINVTATEKIEANASSGGDIDFDGSPSKINKKTSSGGSVSKRN
ncbi:head GIN domain-containing protein [Polaribacter tangerinus]|uniref:head GIN domain-containing protein n=1 Tax=Polaribacter tangerinus TaxID=1920034 RepID=UPI000B4B096E|nr:head GIN domain-containing protein [Polaribacter tangerinus]